MSRRKRSDDELNQLYAQTYHLSDEQWERFRSMNRITDKELSRIFQLHFTSDDPSILSMQMQQEMISALITDYITTIDYKSITDEMEQWVMRYIITMFVDENQPDLYDFIDTMELNEGSGIDHCKIENREVAECIKKMHSETERLLDEEEYPVEDFKEDEPELYRRNIIRVRSWALWSVLDSIIYQIKPIEPVTAVQKFMYATVTQEEANEKNTPIHGDYAYLRVKYLINYKPYLFQAEVADGSLYKELVNLQKHCEEWLADYEESEAIANNVTEELKAKNPMEWVGLKNNIRETGKSIIARELIYI